MKTGIRFFLCIFFFNAGIALVSAQHCNDFSRRDAGQTYTFPSPLGSVTASALLAEYNFSKLETFSDCTILIAAGVDFEIDVPLAMTEVTVIAGENSGIKVNRKKILVLTHCKLIPEEGTYWKGIITEDEPGKLLMKNNQICYASEGFQRELAKKE